MGIRWILLEGVERTVEWRLYQSEYVVSEFNLRPLIQDTLAICAG